MVRIGGSKYSKSKRSGHRMAKRRLAQSLATESARRVSNNIYSVATSAAKTTVNRMAEKRYIINNALLNPSYNGSLVQFTPIPQGDTDSQRQGDQVRLTSVQLRAYVRLTAESSYVFRCIIFRWNEHTSVSVPTVGTVLDIVGSANSPISTYVQDNVRQKLFKILYDKTITIDNTGPSTKKFQMKRRLGTPLSFQAGTTDGRGHIYMLTISNQPPAVASNYYYAYKVVYIDP